MKLEDVSAVAAIGAESSQSPWNENSVLTYFLRDDTLFVVAEESSDIHEESSHTDRESDGEGCAGSDEKCAGSGEKCTGFGEKCTGSGEECAPELRGFTALLLTPPESDIIDIIVSSSHRGQRIGTGLLDWACDLALLRGVDTIFLEVRPGNMPARRLYEHLGFVQCGIRKGYYTDPPEDAIAMVRRRNIIRVGTLPD
jgi:ribosomal protein S18 acetylase RimI-like enzyme